MAIEIGNVCADRNNLEGYESSGLGARSIPVDRLAFWLAGRVKSSQADQVRSIWLL